MSGDEGPRRIAALRNALKAGLSTDEATEECLECGHSWWRVPPGAVTGIPSHYFDGEGTPICQECNGLAGCFVKSSELDALRTENGALRPIVEKLVRAAAILDRCEAKRDWTEWGDDVALEEWCSRGYRTDARRALKEPAPR